jgi:hypothetical protein
VSGVFSLIWMGLGSKLPAIVEVILCWLMLEDVPAQNVGNLYFATWTGFIIACLLASASLRGLVIKEGDEGDTTTEEAKPERAADEENAGVEDTSTDEVAADTGDDKK